ncbi:MAG: response regulator [Bacteroidales bacterium]|nr:response regulator [Bacteroidales bacterium]
MIKTIIIDDEEKARFTLKQLLAEYATDIQIVGEAANVADGLQLIAEITPDLVFLDVQMPDGTGFDLLDKVSNISFKVIFVSAFDHFALTAFKFSAIDYLLKPVNADDLVKALTKIELSGDNQPAKIKVLLGNRSGIEKIVLPSLDELIFVRIDEIVRCESDNNYTHFYLQNGDRILVSRTLKDYEELLESMGFFRIHKSSIINMRFLKKYKKGEGGTVTMEDGTQLEVSRRRKDDFLRTLQNQS